MLTTDQDAAYLDCPACGGWYPDDGQCECGYCPHAGVIEGICPACGTDVEPTMVALIAELLDAADCVVTMLGDASSYLYEHEFGAVIHLRQIVARLQGTAGLRVVGGGEA